MNNKVKFKKGDKVSWMPHIAPWLSKIVNDVPKGSSPRICNNSLETIWHLPYHKIAWSLDPISRNCCYPNINSWLKEWPEAIVVDIDDTKDKSRDNQTWIKLRLTNIFNKKKYIEGWTTNHCIERVK